MDHMMNIKANWKNAALEALIRASDPNQDLSRSAVLERAILTARDVEDWKEVQLLLMDLRKEDGVAVPTSFQAKYSDNAAEILEKVRADILRQLNLKRVQANYLLLLLQANYLEHLRRQRQTSRPAGGSSAEHSPALDLPEVAKVLVEMMLTDPDCRELRLIREILAGWQEHRPMA